MTLELRVLSGSRSGHTASFEQPLVTIGRHASSDLRFDPQADLDVSSRHAEMRFIGGAWSVVDEGSTNGTYVNGVRVASDRRLYDGDIVSFGSNGPRVEVQGAGAPTGTSPAATRVQNASGERKIPPRVDTGVRVAVAVKQQTKTMQRTFIGALVVVAALAIGGFAWMRQQTSVHDAQMNALLAHGDSVTAALQKTIASMKPSDSLLRGTVEQELKLQREQLDNARKLAANGKGSVEDFGARLKPVPAALRMDFSKVSDMNDGAVAMVASDFDGQFIAGTAFGITANGMLITNRHVVKGENGTVARRVAVIFANTTQWLPVKIVRVSESEDLALLQIEQAGTYPMVSGVSRAGSLARVGAPVASIGYPGATDTPMEGSGLKITARTTITAGTVSKRLDDVIQIDSYAGHGSSGSPLFDANGYVVGVVYGGAKESQGRIVYAVPAQKLAAFIGSDGGSVVK